MSRARKLFFNRLWLYLIVGVATCWLLYDFGVRAWFIMRLEPEVVVIRSGIPASDFEGLFEFRGVLELVNDSFSDVQVVGVSASCGCISIGEYPRSVPARGRVNIPWFVRFNGNTGTQAINVFTNIPEKPKLFQKIVVSLP